MTPIVNSCHQITDREKINFIKKSRYIFLLKYRIGYSVTRTIGQTFLLLKKITQKAFFEKVQFSFSSEIFKNKVMKHSQNKKSNNNICGVFNSYFLF
jgi:hypothetical protein